MSANPEGQIKLEGICPNCGKPMTPVYNPETLKNWAVEQEVKSAPPPKSIEDQIALLSNENSFWLAGMHVSLQDPEEKG
jgi:hypothetical protein